jgi:hypothetical protein
MKIAARQAGFLIASMTQKDQAPEAGGPYPLEPAKLKVPANATTCSPASTGLIHVKAHRRDSN